MNMNLAIEQVIDHIERFLLYAKPDTITASTLVYQTVQAYNFLPQYEQLENVIRRSLDTIRIKLEGGFDKSVNEKLYEAFYDVSSFLIDNNFMKQ